MPCSTAIASIQSTSSALSIQRILAAKNIPKLSRITAVTLPQLPSTKNAPSTFTLTQPIRGQFQHKRERNFLTCSHASSSINALAELTMPIGLFLLLLKWASFLSIHTYTPGNHQYARHTLLIQKNWTTTPTIRQHKHFCNCQTLNPEVKVTTPVELQGNHEGNANSVPIWSLQVWQAI